MLRRTLWLVLRILRSILSDTYVHLDGGGGAAPLEGGETFWGRPAADLDPSYPGRLVMAVHCTDNSSWAIHPNGDEFLYLLSGAIDVVLQGRYRERVIELRPGAACIIPQGMWHRQIVHMPSDLLGITFGKGTQHRPV